MCSHGCKSVCLLEGLHIGFVGSFPRFAAVCARDHSGGVGGERLAARPRIAAVRGCLPRALACFRARFVVGDMRSSSKGRAGYGRQEGGSAV